jgi:hypothetical protein
MVYVATRLERIEEARSLLAGLREDGWVPSYDWSTHGPVWRRGWVGVQSVAIDELAGAMSADVVIVLLPGGRGTHVELGAALASSVKRRGTPRIILHGTEEDFAVADTLCAFYTHPNVERAVNVSLDGLRAILLAPRGPRP